MRLTIIEFAPPLGLPRARVTSFLNDADGRIERFQFERRDRPLAAFVPSDFVLLHQALVEIGKRSLCPGSRFLEWGSGAGVVTCLAGMLGFDAVGIEVEQPLVDLAEGLAEEHEVDVEFVCGSFVPDGCDIDSEDQRDINWLRTDAPDAYEELDLTPDDFDLIFAYPWPGEEEIVFNLFERCAAEGALLLTYHGQDGLLLQRKVR